MTLPCNASLFHYYFYNDHHSLAQSRQGQIHGFLILFYHNFFVAAMFFLTICFFKLNWKIFILTLWIIMFHFRGRNKCILQDLPRISKHSDTGFSNTFSLQIKATNHIPANVTKYLGIILSQSLKNAFYVWESQHKKLLNEIKHI